MMPRKREELEIQRNNVTPAAFLAYVRQQIRSHGIQNISAEDINLEYFRAGNDLNFNIDNSGNPGAAVKAEKSVSRPYESQSYVLGWDGNIFNMIMEFTFDDEKKGNGYFYYLNTWEENEMIHNARTKANGEMAIRQLSTLAQIAYDDGICDIDGMTGLTLEQLDSELSARVDIIAYSYHFQDEIEAAILEFLYDTQGDTFRSKLYMTMTNGEPVFDYEAGDVVICENINTAGYDDWEITSYDVFCEFINRMEGNKMSNTKYEVDITYYSNGATSAIDTVTAPTGYTAEDYISDCERNADDDWNEMLKTGDVSLVEIG